MIIRHGSKQDDHRSRRSNTQLSSLRPCLPGTCWKFGNSTCASYLDGLDHSEGAPRTRTSLESHGKDDDLSGSASMDGTNREQRRKRAGDAFDTGPDERRIAEGLPNFANRQRDETRGCGQIHRGREIKLTEKLLGRFRCRSLPMRSPIPHQSASENESNSEDRSRPIGSGLLLPPYHPPPDGARREAINCESGSSQEILKTNRSAPRPFLMKGSERERE